MPWSRRFEESILPPGGKMLLTLEDAARYIQKLPKAEQALTEWQAATEALILAAEDRGPMMHARIGMLAALRRDEPVVFTEGKDQGWGKRKLRRDV